MKMQTGTRRNILYLALFAITLCFFSIEAQAVETRLDLILDDGSVLIYKGKQAGYVQGQELSVVRDGQLVGTVEVTKVMNAYVQAKITSGADKMKELDTVTSTPPAGAAKPAAETKAVETKKTETKKEEPKAAEKTETKKSSSRSSRSSKSKKGDDEEKTEEKKSSSSSTSKSSSRRRSSRTSSKTTADSADTEKKEEEASSKTSSRRGGRSSSRGSSASSGDEKKDDTKTEDAAEAPKVLGKDPYYVMHAGYFYLNESDVPGNVIDRDPSLMFSIDYWQPRKDKNYLVYSAMYSRPSLTTSYAGQKYDYQLRIMEFSVAYIWDELDTFTGTGSSMYGGLGAGWRSASSEIHGAITYDGISDYKKKSMEGMDYHGILGMRFRSKAELKMNYCFDEKYYTIDFGYRY